MNSRLAALFVLLPFLAAAAPTSTPSTAGKKLIHYGWDSPDTAFYRKNIERIAASPFDGIMLTVRPTKGEGTLGGTDSLGWLVWGGEPFKVEQYQHAIDDLQAAPSPKMTDNFIAVISHPPATGFDWFDDAAWKIVVHNITALAKVAKQGGCAGLMFDPEEYTFPMWSYARMPESFRAAHSYTDFVAKVRERGRSFMTAINAEFPNVTVLTLFGPFLYAQNVNWIGAPRTAEANYNLLGPFYDGMVEAADAGSMLVDGYEQSYGYKTEPQFTAGRAETLEAPRR